MTAEKKLEALDRFVRDWRSREAQKHIDDLEARGRLVALNTVLAYMQDLENRG